jgi:hypothetical protein
MPQITGRQIIASLEELQNDCLAMAEREENLRGSKDYSAWWYAREANTAAICALLIERALKKGLEDKYWEFTGLLGAYPGHTGGIYWAFDTIGEALTEQGTLIDESDLRHLRLAFLSAEAEDTLFKFNTNAVIEAHRIARDFIRRCLE